MVFRAFFGLFKVKGYQYFGKILENFTHEVTMKSLRNLISWRASKAKLDQETDRTKTSNEIDTSIESSSKQNGKAKTPSKEVKRPLQIEREEENEVETQEELEEDNVKSDPLNLIFSSFDSSFQNLQNQISKNRDKEPEEKKRNIKTETFQQKGNRPQ